MKITNGILSNVNIKGVEFLVDLIPITNTKARPLTKMNLQYITVHNTGNPNTSAKNNSNYVKNVNNYVSWHFTIDNKNIIQQLPINEVAWHCGDGANGKGNTTSIGIEICEINGAEEVAIKFIAELMKALNLSIDKIIPHKKWSGKDCPRLILPHWDKFIIGIKNSEGQEKRIFKDVEVGRWSEEAIKKCVEMGIINGFEDGTFRPNDAVTREQICNIIYKKIKII